MLKFYTKFSIKYDSFVIYNMILKIAIKKWEIERSGGWCFCCFIQISDSGFRNNVDLGDRLLKVMKMKTWYISVSVNPEGFR